MVKASKKTDAFTKKQTECWGLFPAEGDKPIDIEGDDADRNKILEDGLHPVLMTQTGTKYLKMGFIQFCTFRPLPALASAMKLSQPQPIL